jgi:8-hydroxy-5-deazaflavin:NADPH oxidoreductase
MHLSILGDGALVVPLTHLSRRAGLTVGKLHAPPGTGTSDAAADLFVLAGGRAAIAALVDRVGVAMRDDAVIVDATTPDTLDTPAVQGAVVERTRSDQAWTTRLPGRRVVRAFASVPAEAFSAIVAGGAPRDRSDLAVPLAGDDVDAKAKVSEFMRRIGVEPFDLGPFDVSYVMEAGGPLWGAAVSDVELREMVGWLSGDG